MFKHTKTLTVLSITILVVCLTIFICCDNSLTRTFGGTMTFKLPSNQKLINVTWKNDNIWYLTRQFERGDTVQIYKFTEKSVLGALEGEVTIIETKD